MRSFLCKKPCAEWKKESSLVTWGVIFKDNPGKKLRRHENSKSHKDAIESMTHLQIEGTLSHREDSRRKKESANELYITKLIRIVYFPTRHNLAIKEL